jgi:hypothetical protein
MTSNKEQIFQEHFVAPVNRTGRITVVIAIICLFLPGLYLYFFHGLLPAFKPLISGLIVVWSFMVVMGILEPIVYFPILGLGGTYMSFLVGNILNLRVPVSATAQQVVGTDEGTAEAEVVSTLGIAGSLIASELVMIAGMLLFLPIIGKIQGSGGAMEVALDQVLPALFGALGGIFLFRVPKLGIVPLGLGFIIAGLGLALGVDIPSSIVIPPLVILSIIAARIMYKRGWVKGEGMM